MWGTFLALWSSSRLGQQTCESHWCCDFHAVARTNIREGPRGSAPGHLQERNNTARSMKVKLVIKDRGTSGCSWQENQLIIPQKQETPKCVIFSNHYPSHPLLFKVVWFHVPSSKVPGVAGSGIPILEVQFFSLLPTLHCPLHS